MVRILPKAQHERTSRRGPMGIQEGHPMTSKPHRARAVRFYSAKDSRANGVKASQTLASSPGGAARASTARTQVRLDGPLPPSLTCRPPAPYL